MSGASRARGRARTSSATLGADEDSTTWRATSADDGAGAPAASAGSATIAGSCSSVAATPSAAGPLSRTRRLRWRCGRYCPSTLSGKSPAICASAVAGGRPRAEEGVQRLEARPCCCADARSGRSARNQVLVLHRPAHRLGLAVGHHERRRAVVAAAAIAAAFARVGRLRARAGSAGRRASCARLRRADACTWRSRRRRRGRRRRACRRAAGVGSPRTATARCLPENLAKMPPCAIGPNWRSVTCSPL